MLGRAQVMDELSGSKEQVRELRLRLRQLGDELDAARRRVSTNDRVRCGAEGGGFAVQGGARGCRLAAAVQGGEGGVARRWREGNTMGGTWWDARVAALGQLEAWGLGGGRYGRRSEHTDTRKHPASSLPWNPSIHPVLFGDAPLQLLLLCWRKGLTCIRYRCARSC